MYNIQLVKVEAYASLVIIRAGSTPADALSKKPILVPFPEIDKVI
jgi:hypothetical protein